MKNVLSLQVYRELADILTMIWLLIGNVLFKISIGYNHTL